MSIQCKSQQSLKESLKDKFLIGVAVNDNQVTGKDSLSDLLILHHFNTITAENCMKSEVIQPQEGKFDFTQSDRFVEFGQKHKMFIIGHTLIWHSQAPAWFFVDQNGKDVSREVLIERMRKHITTVVGRYKGRVNGWDVVNEAIEDDGSWRQSKFYRIIGEDYVKLAFQFAHEADPKAELYYNDYSMAHPGRRDAVVEMIKKLREQGIKVDGIGMQGHLTMSFPTVESEEKSIIAFGNLGVKVMITEMDLTVIPFPNQNGGADVSMSYEYKKEMNPYPDGLPDSVATVWNNRMADFFRLFLKHHDKISRVTIWGVSDAQTWRNNWPIPGRKDYPLLFDRNLKPKPIVETIIKEAKATKK
ncbi:MAG: endo-1,4-beta-xylanase [Bacteroidales bacterium]|nr:endo-1,4-beta-xylanase [Bacteroidales bacterium]